MKLCRKTVTSTVFATLAANVQYSDQVRWQDFSTCGFMPDIIQYSENVEVSVGVLVRSTRI